MFASKGWKDLIEDLQRLEASIADTRSIKDEADLYRRQGALEMLDYFKGLEQLSEQSYETLKEEKKETQGVLH